MKIIPLPRNSESTASANKRFSRYMIDGESRKAELLQSNKCSSGNITNNISTKSYSYVYFMKISKVFTAKRHVKLELKVDICTIRLKYLLLDKTKS